jgi:iron complex outermembrane recepter protein
MKIKTGGIRSRHGLLLGVAGLALTATASPTLAQEDPAVEEGRGTEIIVTAQRRQERLEDVPMTVQVVSQETLTNVGVNW